MPLSVIAQCVPGEVGVAGSGITTGGGSGFDEDEDSGGVSDDELSWGCCDTSTSGSPLLSSPEEVGSLVSELLSSELSFLLEAELLFTVSELSSTGGEDTSSELAAVLLTVVLVSIPVSEEEELSQPEHRIMLNEEITAQKRLILSGIFPELKIFINL